MMLYGFLFSQATLSSSSDGRWDQIVWNVDSGSDDDAKPDANDHVIINHNVSISNLALDHAICQSIEVSSGKNIQLDATDTKKLFIQGSTSPLDCHIDGNITGPGKFHVSRNRDFAGSGSIDNVYLLINNYILNCDVDISVNRIRMTVGSSLILADGATATINGKVTKGQSGGTITNNGTFIINTSDFLGASSTQKFTDVFKSQNGNIELNYTGDFPLPKDNALKNVSILGGSITADGDFSVSGNWVNNATFSSSSGNTITFNGSNPSSITGTGTNNFYNILLNKTFGGLTLGDGSSNKPTINLFDVMETSSGNFTQDGATVVLKSNASNNGAIVVGSSLNYQHTSGAFTSELFYNATKHGYRMVCSPIKSSTLAELDDEYIFCGIDGATANNNFSFGGCGFYNVKTYNSASDLYVDVTSISQSISDGIGTLIYTSAGATNLSMTNGLSENDPCFTDVTISGETGYNLVSNPYPANLNFSSLRTESGTSNFTDDYWIFSGDAGNYKDKEDLGESIIIAQNQGFFVHLSDAKDIDFKVNQTTKSSSSFEKSNNGINLPLSLRLTSDQNTYYDNAHLKAGSEYTIDYDSTQESPKLYTPYPDYAPNIYFLDNQNNDLHKMCINNNQSANVFFDVKAGNLAHGSHTIKFNNLSQFMVGSCLILEDLHNGTITDLRTDSVYSFSSDSLAPMPRFKLQISVNYDINVTNSSCYNDSNAMVSLTGIGLAGRTFNLIDNSNNVIDSVLASHDSIYFEGLNAGIYNIITNDSNACSMENQDIIITQPAEVISQFSTSIDTIFLDTNLIEEILFRNTSSGASHYNWHFGDGNSSDMQNPTHSFLCPGSYTVLLNADNDSIGICTSQFQKVINVIDTTNLFVGFDTQVACDSFTWINGITYNSNNNIASTVLSSSNGCDSTVFLNLTIYPKFNILDTRIACDSLEWIDGSTYFSNNNSSNLVLQTIHGCDSIINLNLTINSSQHSNDIQSSCDSFTWMDGVTYNSSNNSATYILETTNGCDSIITLDLTINNSSTSTDLHTACDNFIWIDGIEYTSSNNTATHTLQNYHGCDSIVNFDLTILNTTYGVDSITTQDSLLWIDGNIYSSSNNTATHTLTNSVGCDSVVTLNLTILNSLDINNKTIIFPVIYSENKSIIIKENLNHYDNISIYDITGRLVLKTNFINKLNLPYLNDGIYIINLSNSYDRFTQKIYISERN